MTITQHWLCFSAALVGERILCYPRCWPLYCLHVNLDHLIEGVEGASLAVDQKPHENDCSIDLEAISGFLSAKQQREVGKWQLDAPSVNSLGT